MGAEGRKTIAVVGSGGKTTYVKHAVKKYLSQGKKVFVTTTTHMFIEENSLLTDDADEIIRELQEKKYAMAGISCGEKIKALSDETYKKACEYADIVLVEADGSKQMPVKFPDYHEPVIPENADEIVVVCTLQALGKSLIEAAHRPELVKACLNAEDQTVLEAHHVQKLVRTGYTEPLKKKYPDKRILIHCNHDTSLYQRTAAKLIESDMDATVIDKNWFRTQPELIICGGGHVSCELVKIASCLDFKITVLDDRAEFASNERFPLAHKVICDSFDHLDNYMVKDACYVVVTRGHQHDFECVSRILSSPFTYLGMIGSKAKVKATFEKLKNEGFSEDAIANVHAPIGLRIGAKTPAEIAVSILAEIIQVKYEKGGACISPDLDQIEGKGILCIITEKQGSAPQGTGCMMFVADEHVTGTIGGGVIEYAVIQDARKAETVFQKEYNVGNETAGNMGMICGGRNTVLFVPLQ